jgi:hypothetical protein
MHYLAEVTSAKKHWCETNQLHVYAPLIVHKTLSSLTPSHRVRFLEYTVLFETSLDMEVEKRIRLFTMLL